MVAQGGGGRGRGGTVHSLRPDPYPTVVGFVQYAYNETESTGPLTPLEEIMLPNGMKDDVMNTG